MAAQTSIRVRTSVRRTGRDRSRGRVRGYGFSPLWLHEPPVGWVRIRVGVELR